MFVASSELCISQGPPLPRGYGGRVELQRDIFKFLLGDDLGLFDQAMNLQLRVVAANSTTIVASRVCDTTTGMPQPSRIRLAPPSMNEPAPAEPERSLVEGTDDQWVEATDGSAEASTEPEEQPS